MALSIKTEEADRLARALSELTGESLTETVTVALRERFARERVRRNKDDNLPTRLAATSQRLRAFYDTRPVIQEEWDAACGETN